MNQNEIKNLFDYDEGKLIWRYSPSHSVKAGDIAGNHNDSGYIVIRYKGTAYLAHRLIYMWHYGHCPSILDHVDRNRTNNRIENLRPSTAEENQLNRSVSKKNVVGCSGVRLDKRSNKWKVQITHKKKQYHVGYYTHLEDAINAREQAEKELWNA